MGRKSKGAPYRIVWADTGKTWGDRDGLATLAIARREAAYCRKWSRGEVMILDGSGNYVRDTHTLATRPQETTAPDNPCATIHAGQRP